MKAEEFPSGMFFPERMFHLIFPSLLWYMMVWPFVVVFFLLMVVVEIVKFVYLAGKAIYGFVVDVRKEMQR